jgi:uncharacterized protein
MNDSMYSKSLSQKDIALEQSRFISKVFGWMSVALLITTLTSLWVAQSPELVSMIFGQRFVFFGLIIGEVLLVGYISSRIQHLSATTATLLFVGYAALNGVTISFIFLVYNLGSIVSTFLVTTLTFGIMSVYGYFTKTDLTKMGNLLGMALIGLVVGTIVNIFWANSTLYWICTYAGVVIFIGLTAYDTQKIKEMNIIGNEGTDEDRKEAILGALTLYLDFINLFLFLLRIMGNRRN